MSENVIQEMDAWIKHAEGAPLAVERVSIPVAQLRKWGEAIQEAEGGSQ